MKSFLLTIAAVQILHCSGVPDPEDALRVAITKLNEISEISHLCGITSSTVRDLSPTGKFSYNVDVAFTVKETVCSKNSGLEFDDSSCNFRPAKIAETASCKSRVKYLADEVLDVDVECHGFKKTKVNGELSEKVKSNGEISKGGNGHSKPSKGGKGHGKKEKVNNNGGSSDSTDSSEEVQITSEESSLEEPLNEHNVDSRARH